MIPDPAITQTLHLSMAFATLTHCHPWVGHRSHNESQTTESCSLLIALPSVPPEPIEPLHRLDLLECFTTLLLDRYPCNPPPISIPFLDRPWPSIVTLASNWSSQLLPPSLIACSTPEGSLQIHCCRSTAPPSLLCCLPFLLSSLSFLTFEPLRPSQPLLAPTWNGPNPGPDPTPSPIQLLLKV